MSSNIGRGSGSSSRQGSASGSQHSSSSRQGPSSRRASATNPGSSRLPATSSRLVEPKSSITRTQSTNIENTCSGTKINAQSKISATRITKVPARAGPQSFSGPPGAARIRLASTATKDPTSYVQTTKVKVLGAGLKPTGTTKSKCPAVCSKRPSEPILEPFTEEVERGRPVPPGMYYMPLKGATEQGLGPDERKLRQKLQKYTPTSLSHWKVESSDPFAGKVGPLRKAHPDVVSGVFRSARPAPFQPDYRNPQLEQRLDPSLPPEAWSLALREAMSLETATYEQQNPDDGERDTFTVENTKIQREIDAQLPGGTVCESQPSQQPKSPSSASQNVLMSLLPATQTPANLETIRSPEYEHTVDVSEVTSPRIQSPVGEIEAQRTIHMQRQVQASHLGTIVDTAVRGTKLVAPGQAKQIDIVKQDRLPPPSRAYPPALRGYPYTESMIAQNGSPGPASFSPSPVPSSASPEQRRTRSPMTPSKRPLPPSPVNLEAATPSKAYSPALRGYPYTESMITQSGSPGPASFSPNPVPASASPEQSPARSPMTPSKRPLPPSPVNLEAAAPVPDKSNDASLDVLRRLVDEERQDVAASQQLSPALTKKLNKLKKKPQSMRILEETLDQSIPIDEESDNLKSDIIAELMHSQETGVINPASSPRKTYDQLFPPLEDEQQIAVSPAAPAPLNDIVVPVGEADVNDVAMVNEMISEVAAEETGNIPAGNAFATAAANEERLSQPSPPREHKSREKKESKDDDAEYIPRGELDEQKAPWDIDLGSLEDLVGGKMSMMSAWENLPSDESVRATAGRLEYVLDVQKPQHHSCVQLRGSQLPAWFPGYYSVLPHVEDCVRLERSPSRAFAAAWHVFAPHTSADQSEVVLL